jgi:hypothetical protein
MSCEIIQFSAAARPARLVSDKQAAPDALTSHRAKRIAKREAKLLEIKTSPEKFTETCKNSRLRLSRRDAWWTAGHLTDYWRARLDWQSALSMAQSHNLADANSYPKCDGGERFGLVDTWREAVVKQLLTPAPDGAAVAWKRAKLAGRGFSHLPTKAERIERVIAEDLAFLAAHPTRRSNSEAMAHKREFNDAMRQRIREIAASRDLSDEEIKPVLSLKHQRVAEFVDKHGVNFEWLLEGRGRTFKKDPIRLCPNMTGGELAAVVATMPMADQQEIRAKARELLQEQDQ